MLSQRVVMPAWGWGNKAKYTELGLRDGTGYANLIMPVVVRRMKGHFVVDCSVYSNFGKREVSSICPLSVGYL